jgi:hypothetical protein
MTTIHYLAAREPTARRRAIEGQPTSGTMSERARTAEIILFTGVRYERWTDAPAAAVNYDNDPTDAACNAQQRIEA